MKEIISKTFNRKQTTKNYSKYYKTYKDRNNNLTVFETNLHTRIHPKTEAIPLRQTASLQVMGLKCYLKTEPNIWTKHIKT